MSYTQAQLARIDRRQTMDAQHYRQGLNGYYSSDYWQVYRSQVLAQNPTCSVCDVAPSIMVHHLGYNRLFREVVGLSVIATCTGCHFQMHGRKF